MALPHDVPKSPVIFRLERKNLDGYFPEALLLPHQENCQTANIRVDRVQKTIDELGLNCERLRRIRGKVLVHNDGNCLPQATQQSRRELLRRSTKF
jgi:hypothetical protein